MISEPVVQIQQRLQVSVLYEFGEDQSPRQGCWWEAVTGVQPSVRSQSLPEARVLKGGRGSIRIFTGEIY